MFACKDETKTNNISQVNSEIAFKSFFDQGIIPEILQLDSLYNSEFEKWTEFISFSLILNDMSWDDKNHRIMISSLSNKLDHIEIDNIENLKQDDHKSIKKSLYSPSLEILETNLATFSARKFS